MQIDVHNAATPIGALIRDWRQRRRFSQLALAYDADISPKHLSFVESGRARPSRDMVMTLAERLQVPLRERNRLLLAAGYAPVFKERPLDHPELAEVKRAVDFVLARHAPYPALAVDRHWNLVSANEAVAPLMASAAAELLQAPINVLRITLHPKGLAPRIANLSRWRTHIFERLGRQIDSSGDPELVTLLRELQAYPDDANTSRSNVIDDAGSGVLVPLTLVTEHGKLSFVSTTMMFGSPLDVFSSELAIETFFPADDATAAAYRASSG